MVFVDFGCMSLGVTMVGLPAALFVGVLPELSLELSACAHQHGPEERVPKSSLHHMIA